MPYALVDKKQVKVAAGIKKFIWKDFSGLLFNVLKPDIGRVADNGVKLVLFGVREKVRFQDTGIINKAAVYFYPDSIFTQTRKKCPIARGRL